MCGFAGFITDRSETLEKLESVAASMASAISSRGPDDEGTWGAVCPREFSQSFSYAETQSQNNKSASKFGIAFGFRRLAILELSNAGHQPMTSQSGRYVIAFNGEIYNHMELRALLPGVISWRGHSDTETLLACFEAFGVEQTLKKTIGMFAVALWDEVLQTLFLTRDRFGEKPLYYGWTGGTNLCAPSFVFGSELKALRVFPKFGNQVSRDALTLFMRFSYVPTPYSIYEEIFKLEPGCLLSVKASEILGTSPLTSPLRPGAVIGGLSMHRWWSLASVVSAGTQNPIGSDAQAIQMLEEQLSDSVKLQSLADVPLGAFLSGGVDSSTIVALMQPHAKKPVKTFTIGFEESGFDESPYAKAVANHLHTDHTELFVTSKEAQNVILDLPNFYDEPFADPSQIPTYLVSKLAKNQVTVALSGDAGDELFGGYSRYIWASRIWSRLDWMPYAARLALGKSIKQVPYGAWDFFGSSLTSMFDNSKGVVRFGEKAHKLAHRLSGVRNLDDLYVNLVSEWQDPGHVVKRNGKSDESLDALMRQERTEPFCLLDDKLPSVGVESHQLQMMYKDSMTYLPDDILCKVDRAGMATSLETRVPFLDHRVVELAWRLPLNMKIRDGQGKWVLRQVLYKYVPSDLIDRPKAGFAIPIGQWLRGPLRQWAEELISEERLESDGYFYVEPIQRKWREHLSGKFDHAGSLWTVLIFQSWLDRYKPNY
jgi:asparagine synthase (glutamine-hydrolysing)